MISRDRVHRDWVHRASAYLVLGGLLLVVVLLRRPPAPEIHIEDHTGSAPPFTVDLNHDSWQRISLIAGIGETLARRIVEERQARGGFASLEEVMAVPGVPDPPLERARPWLALGDIGTTDR